jgi:hypothetical protein
MAHISSELCELGHMTIENLLNEYPNVFVANPLVAGSLADRRWSRIFAKFWINNWVL